MSELVSFFSGHRNPWGTIAAELRRIDAGLSKLPSSKYFPGGVRAHQELIKLIKLLAFKADVVKPYGSDATNDLYALAQMQVRVDELVIGLSVVQTKISACLVNANPTFYGPLQIASEGLGAVRGKLNQTKVQLKNHIDEVASKGKEE